MTYYPMLITRAAACPMYSSAISGKGAPRLHIHASSIYQDKLVFFYLSIVILACFP